jgi:hypothetical protein
MVRSQRHSHPKPNMKQPHNCRVTKHLLSWGKFMKQHQILGNALRATRKPLKTQHSGPGASRGKKRDKEGCLKPDSSGAPPRGVISDPEGNGVKFGVTSTVEVAFWNKKMRGRVGRAAQRE